MNSLLILCQEHVDPRRSDAHGRGYATDAGGPLEEFVVPFIVHVGGAPANIDREKINSTANRATRSTISFPGIARIAPKCIAGAVYRSRAHKNSYASVAMWAACSLFAAPPCPPSIYS